MGDAVLVIGIDDDAGPGGIVHVAMLLAVEGVGLVEGDPVAACVQGAEEAAVVGGGAVPVGGNETGTEEGDVEAAGHVVFHSSEVAGWEACAPINSA